MTCLCDVLNAVHGCVQFSVLATRLHQRARVGENRRRRGVFARVAMVTRLGAKKTGEAAARSRFGDLDKLMCLVTVIVFGKE